ncbi:Probable endopeptidase Spr precursor [Blautia hydrogenotrophica]|uniref:C40 family peptidase n=1 Tax=Blautia hydrogenotrophica TaxID=53443 RepID=UPI0006C450E4|nr:C40 family peptidase [Blautia hydrogenotrophica]CUN11862.1 Probable endopeptidase Spr precursor [Blautia hydrogenotrophica]SCH68181.1 Probable endopeptidase Spr precursor [uncultured Blautia sp.]
MKKRIVCLTLALLISASQVMTVSASREEELREEAAYTSSQLDATYSYINDLGAQIESLNAEIASLDQDLVNTMVNIEVLNTDISNKEAEIQKTRKNLKRAKANKEKQYEAMKLRIQYLYENGGSNAWYNLMLDSNDLSELLNKAEYTQKMYKYDRDALNKYVETIKEIKTLGVQLNGEKAELEDMKAEQEANQANLEVQISEKQSAANNASNEIAYAQQQANEYAALLEEQTAEIQRLEAERIAAEEEARRQAEAEAAAAAAAAAAEEANNQEEDTDAEDADGEEDYTEEDGTYEEDGSEDVVTDEYGNVIDEDNTVEDTDYSESGSTDSSVSYSGSGSSVADYATQFVGNPYVYGGTSLTNGADCSGFVQSVYANFGVSLPRTSYDQMNVGTEVSYSEAQPGDLICYGGHVAIYLGGGRIVHASNSAPYPAGGIKISDNAAYRTILSVRRVM